MSTDWIATQTRVFTAWVNNVLKVYYKEKAPVVTNLFTDLSTGVVLHRLLVALFAGRGAKIPQINDNPKMRPQYLDNVTQCLNVLPSVGVMTVFLTPMQVVDGDGKMILGLIWRLILATQIATLKETSSEFIMGGDERQIDGGAKQALLEWCRKRLMPYPSVKVENFTSSWRSGMAFLGLLHSQNPNLFQFDAIDPNRAEDNLHLAFEIAEKEFHIPKLIEAGDVLGPNVDERSIITYVSEFCKLDRLNKPEDTSRMRLLDEREQALAMREAELQKQAFEQARNMKTQTEQQLAELRAKEDALRGASQQLSELEKQHKAELERALTMQREADQRMEQAASAGKAALSSQQAADAERQRLAELERKLKEQAAQLAAQQDQMSRQQQMEAIEKAFAEQANNVDRFIVEEERKVNDPAATPQTLEPIVKFGIPHGEEMLLKLRGLAEQAGKAGLQANRFTHHTVLSLEERWRKFSAVLNERVQGLQQRSLAQQAPPPQQQQQYPQPPPQQQYPQPPQQQQYPQPPSQQQQYPQPPQGQPTPPSQVQYPQPPPGGAQQYGNYPPQSQPQYPPTPGMGMPPHTPGMGLPPTPGMGMPPQTPGMGLPPTPGMGLPPAPQYGYSSPSLGAPPPSYTYAPSPSYVQYPGATYVAAPPAVVYGYQPAPTVVYAPGHIKYKHGKMKYKY